MTDAIKVDGLTQFSKALKEIDAQLPKMLRLALNTVANEVITLARADVPSRSGRARASIKASSRQDAVRASEGGSKAPWMPWLDYGGEGRRRGRPSKRPFVKSGRFLYPAYFRFRDSGDMNLLLTNALFDVVRATGIEVD
jgi:hypothetical protein